MKSNKQQFRTYQKKEALDLAESRQLLNAPPELRRTDRVFSNLDVMLAVKMELTRANHSHALEVTIPPARSNTQCTLSGRCVYTAMQQVYTFVSPSIHISFPCVYTRRSPKYTHQSMCIHIHTVAYTHYHCVYTHRLTTPVGGASAAQHGGYGQGGVIPAADADESLV